MRYWLFKSEPYKFSIDNLAASPDQTTAWDGVRNYQARNFMWKQMKIGDQAFFYHSCCPQPGITGIAKVTKSAYPDVTQFDPKSRYHDPKANQEKPRWFNVEITFIQKTRLLTIKELRQYPELKRMRILQPGNRLSITPVDPDEWRFILKILRA
ncbi:MAG TPA: EVE domain-containing protein [Nitrosomonas sp.]|nr:EVE domain-containing protein [Nitrosomonas sp.]HNP25241.1 EVE domain-containing protein [Nitrosomonas sp.]